MSQAVVNTGSDFSWFPLYAESFLSSRSVAIMTNEQVGMFIKLMCWQWKDGPLPEDTEALLALCGGNARALQGVLKAFKLTGRGYVNENLERVRQDQDEKAEKASEHGRKAANSRWGNKKRDNARAMPEQCPRYARGMPLRRRRRLRLRQRLKPLMKILCRARSPDRASPMLRL